MQDISLENSCSFMLSFSIIHISLFITNGQGSFICRKPFLVLDNNHLIEMIGTNPGSPQTSDTEQAQLAQR